MSSTLSTESFYTTLEQKFSTVFFYLNGIVANSSNPFRILINDECVLKLESNCTSVVYATQVEEPRVGGHHFIRVKADCPLLRSGSGLSSHYERYNLSINGFFILIDCTEEFGGGGGGIHVIQQKHDNFGTQYKNYKFGNLESEKAILKVSSCTSNLINSNLPPKKIEEQLKKLEQLFRKDILTQQEFEQKWKMVYNCESNDLGNTYSNWNNSNSSSDAEKGLTTDQIELLSKLRGLIGRGIITQEEYNAKLKKMKEQNGSTPQQPPQQRLTPQQEQMLEKLQSLLSKKILTLEEFEQKKKQILSTTAVSTPTSPPGHGSSAEISFEEYVQQCEDLKCMMNESQKHQMKTLERFVVDEIITQDEYEIKKKTVLGKLYTPTVWSYQKKLNSESLLSNSSVPKAEEEESTTAETNQRIDKLQKLTERGILTNEMFESRRQQILDENKPPVESDDYSNLSSDQQNYIAKLKHFKKMGILTPSEFDLQLQRVINGDLEGLSISTTTTTTTTTTIKNTSSPKTSSPTRSTTATTTSSVSSSSSPKTPKDSTPVTPTTATSVLIPKKAQPSVAAGRPVFSSEEVDEDQRGMTTSTTSTPTKTPKESTPATPVTTPIVNTHVIASTSASTSNATTVVENDEEIQDQLERLKSLVEMGIITEEDYKHKEEKLLLSKSPISTTTPTGGSSSSGSTTPVVAEQESKTVVASTPPPLSTEMNQKSTTITTTNKSNNTDHQIKQLEKLFNSGIISKEDFDQKVQKLKLGTPTTSSGSTNAKVESPSSSAATSSPTRSSAVVVDSNQNSVELTKLKKLLDNGIISKEQFEMKQSKLLGQSSPTTPPTEKPQLSLEQQEQLSKLKSFLEEGLIDADEYQDEVNQILNSK